MARKRQADLTSGQTQDATRLTPLASPVRVAAPGIGPTPVQQIAFDSGDARASYEMPCCGFVVLDKDRWDMVSRAEWVQEEPVEANAPPQQG